MVQNGMGHGVYLYLTMYAREPEFLLAQGTDQPLTP
jgi:hypothetical protein